jgi:hypothetical protein
MSEPVVLRWPLPGITTVEGVLITCPECGAEDRLALGMDLDDRSDGPAYMSCQQGHLWAEERFSRRIAGEFLDEMLQLDPTLLGHLDDLRDAQARKGPTA